MENGYFDGLVLGLCIGFVAGMVTLFLYMWAITKIEKNNKDDVFY